MACAETAIPAHVVRHLSEHVFCSHGTVCCNQGVSQDFEIGRDNRSIEEDINFGANTWICLQSRHFVSNRYCSGYAYKAEYSRGAILF